ncbi:MAG: hypothetical protein K1X53_02265 [Candidatus Sumerlaeaceae bacterium]|nr:hypothetical protein [Candidatus Sumerlaeaceae bacterium]
MEKNLTLRLDERLLKEARHLAVEKNMSLSKWVAGLLEESVRQDASLAAARNRALSKMKKGWRLGGTPLRRDETHER